MIIQKNKGFARLRFFPCQKWFIYNKIESGSRVPTTGRDKE